MENKRYFLLTKIAIWLSILLGLLIVTLAVVNYVLLISKNSSIYNYYHNSSTSTLLPTILSFVELVIGIFIVLLNFLVLISKKVLKFVAFIFIIFSLLFATEFFALLGVGVFNYFTIQTFAGPLYFIIIFTVSIAYWLNFKNIEVKLINHNKVQLEYIYNDQEEASNLENNEVVQEETSNLENNEVVQEETSNLENNEVVQEETSAKVEKKKKDKKIKEKAPEVLTFDFVEPTLENKTEEEIQIIQKEWEEVAQKLNVLKFQELKNIANEKNIRMPKAVKKVQLVNLLKKIVKISTKRMDITNSVEIEQNGSKLEMFTLVELKNILKKEEMTIFSGAIKKDYVGFLKDKIKATIEFIV